MSERKDLSAGPIVVLVLLIIFVFVLYVIIPAIRSNINLRFGDGIFKVHVTTNINDISKITKLNDNQAYLVSFPNDSIWSIEARNVKTPVDVVWLNSEKKLIFAWTNISPDEYSTKVYSPDSEARYILIFPADTVKNKSLNKGKEAIFEINEGI